MIRPDLVIKKNLIGWSAIAVFFVATLSLFGFEKSIESEGTGGAYFHSSSDGMMQTLPSVQLKEAPLFSLFYLHVQPPLLDALRATVLAFIDVNNTNQNQLGARLDSVLYKLWIVCFGILAVLIFLWISLATRSIIFAGVMAVGWILYPTPIFLATHLDGTLISTLGISWLVLEIWLLSNGSKTIWRVVIAALFCFLTRSFFQWYFFPILIAALFLVGVDRKRLGLITLAVVIGAGSFLVKQYLVFGTVSTNGFAGEHMTGMLWIEKANPSGGDTWLGTETDRYQEMLQDYIVRNPRRYPRQAEPYSGNYNTEKQWQTGIAHAKIAKEVCSSDPEFCVKALWRSFRQNWPEYWYVEGWSNNRLIERLPVWYKTQYYRVTTRFPLFLGISIILFVLIQARKGKIYGEWKRKLGLILIPGFIFGICIFGNRFDWYEGGRLKFFLEPVYFVFISSQIYLFFSRFWGRKE